MLSAGESFEGRDYFSAETQYPELDNAFAFVPTSLHLMDGFNGQGKVNRAEMLRCANKIDLKPL